MNVILVPGFWLGAWSWEKITLALGAAGHHILPMTLPGLGSVDEDRIGIGMAETVAAVVEEIDRTDGDVVLVGHSGGGCVVYGAADQRVNRVRRLIFVDSGPLADGSKVNPSLPGNDIEIPLPDWEFFKRDDDASLSGLSDDMLAAFRSNAVPQPWGVANDPIVVNNPGRLDLPMTVIATTFSQADVTEAIANHSPYFAELACANDLDIVELPTGHWPQFSRPHDLARAILDAL